MPKKKETKNLFPHPQFPFRLEYMDGDDKVICWFSMRVYLDKHLKRYKINKNKVRIDERDNPSNETKPKPTRPARKSRKKSSNS